MPLPCHRPLTRPRPHALALGGTGRKGTIVLATYEQAEDVARTGLEFWRVCADEPHAVLTAKTKSGYVEASPHTQHCAALGQLTCTLYSV